MDKSPAAISPLLNRPAAHSALHRPHQNERNSSFSSVFRALGTRIDAGSRATEQALRARASMSPSELLALQAGVYRYNEAVDLAGKLIDKSTTALKTVLQGQ